MPARMGAQRSMGMGRARLVQPPKQRPTEACTEGPPQHLPQQRLWTLQQRYCVCPVSTKSSGGPWSIAGPQINLRQ